MAAPLAAAVKKLLVKLAVDVATDEEKRRRMLIAITAPVVGLLLLTAFIVYLLTSPLSFLYAWLLPDELRAVTNFQQEFGYNQTIGIYERDYIVGSGINYGDIVFTDGVIDVIYFNQLDIRFANQPFGTDRIGTHGCGPAALSIVVSSLTDRIVDPIEMAEWAVANGGWAREQGSFHSLIPNGARGFGLTVEYNVQNNPQRILDALHEGKLVIALMARGHFTRSGHFIVLRGVTADGQILVADPASLSRSERPWDFQLILDEARRGAGAGGAFWIIGP
ncbi:MAG: C39 family peptidase [Defluviitaleaceae bacterium]|nr:C39 family peptidase [Defluviitaleaceae bacterium]MCL2275152.1 C39 family peptidase [Defluviitaleaceae bacterium]